MSSTRTRAAILMHLGLAVLARVPAIALASTIALVAVGAPRAQADPAIEPPPSARWIQKRLEWKKLSTAERHEAREAIEQARHKAAIEQLPEGWSSKKSKHFLVLYHCDARYAGRVADAVEAFHKWLEGEFGEVSDEYVRRPILRICKDYEEYQTVTGIKAKDKDEEDDPDEDVGTGPRIPMMTFADYQDVVVFYEGGSQPRYLGPIFRAVYHRYLVDKDPLLYRYLPRWFDAGITSMFDGAKMKGRKIEWKPTDNERAAIADAVRKKAIYPIKTVLRLDDKGYEELIDNDPNATLILAAMVRFQLTAGKRQKLLKGLVPELMKSVISVAEAHPWPKDQQVLPDPKPPEDEPADVREERLEKANEEWDKRRRTLFDAMPDFTQRGKDKAWAKLQRIWQKAI